MIEDAALEPAPSDEQKHRLQDWLTELKIICARYRLVLDTDEGETRVIDIERGTTIGIGVTYLLEPRGEYQLITAYDCAGSILDGIWMINATDGGAHEQRSAGTVFPAPVTARDEP